MILKEEFWREGSMEKSLINKNQDKNLMTALSSSDKKLYDDIEEFGWHVIKVPGDEVGPGFGYSIGPYKTFGQPELIIIGLKLDLIHSIINGIGEDIKSGKVFTPGQYYSDLIEGFDCYFTSVEKKFYNDYVGYSKWYYKKTDFPLTQCIYPTLKGIYPWQNEWPEEIRGLQPILGNIIVSRDQ